MSATIEKIEKPYSGVSIETHVTLDWYSSFGIPVIKSDKRAEEYKTPNGISRILNSTFGCIITQEQYDDYRYQFFEIFGAIEKFIIAFAYKQHNHTCNIKSLMCPSSTIQAATTNKQTNK